MNTVPLASPAPRILPVKYAGVAKAIPLMLSVTVIGVAPGILSAASTQAPAAEPAGASESVNVRYRVECKPTGASPHWQVNVHVTKLDSRQRDFEMRLDPWGGWAEVDSYYLTGVEGIPSVRRDPKSPQCLRFDLPQDWNGTICLSYRIVLSTHGSKAFDRHHLLPVLAESYSFGYAVNTLAGLFHGDAPVPAERTVELVAPPGWRSASGWAGLAEERQEVRLGKPIRDENAIIVFGKPMAVRDAPGDPGFQVLQFGTAADITQSALETVTTVIPSYSRNAGRACLSPVRVFVADTYVGGTHTTYGVRVGFDQDAAPGSPDPYITHLIAHELFHIWLGGMAHASHDSLVWFYEGFTNYLSLWHLASLGLVSKDWFAQRILEWEEAAQASSSYGRVSFADADVKWRDSEGPNEVLAYNAGALLAFYMDARLRKDGGPGAIRLIHDLVHADSDEYSQETIRAWMKLNGVGDVYDRHVAGTEKLDVQEALSIFGYQRQVTEVHLTYLGVRSDRDEIPTAVVALDSDGPAARAGVRQGDRIIGFFPTRASKVRVADKRGTEFRFGLALFEPNTEGTFLDIQRGDESLQINLEPRLIEGGQVITYREDATASGPFFAYKP